MKSEQRLEVLRREHWVLAAIFIAALVVVWRAWQVQIVQADFLQQQAHMRHVQTLTLSASRGVIYDRNGEVLALSAPVADIWIDPKVLCHAPEALRPVAQQLHLNWRVLQNRMLSRCDSRFMYLKRQVFPEVAERISQLKLSGVYVTPTYKRYYPQAEVSAHLIGFTDIDDRGQAGLESVFDHWLSGTSGKIRVIKNLKGEVVEFYDELKPLKPGQDMTLALDQRIQYFTYRALKKAMIMHQAKAAAAVVLDAKTGEILAMASQPGFNPNDRSQLKPKLTRNHAVADLFEPGSTLKPFVMAKALDLKVVTPEEVIDTRPGRLKVRDRIVRDEYDKGVLSLADIIKYSSNVGISKVALRMPAAQQWQLFADLGFNRDSGLYLFGENSAAMAPAIQWGPVEQAWAAFGYGVQVNLLQLARAYLALAHDGALLPLSLFVPEHPPEAVKRVFSVEAARQVRSMMEQVTVQGGTAPKAHIPGYSVAGKTGTVHKSRRGGYSLEKYRSLFAGIVPADQPEFVMVVLVDEPARGVYYGGAVAAPIFKEVMMQALRLRNVPPDRAE